MRRSPPQSFSNPITMSPLLIEKSVEGHKHRILMRPYAKKQIIQYYKFSIQLKSLIEIHDELLKTYHFVYQFSTSSSSHTKRFQMPNAKPQPMGRCTVISYTPTCHSFPKYKNMPCSVTYYFLCFEEVGLVATFALSSA